MLHVMELIKKSGCKYQSENDDHIFAVGDDASCLRLTRELLDKGFYPEVNQGCGELTVVRF